MAILVTGILNNYLYRVGSGALARGLELQDLQLRFEDAGFGVQD